AGTCPSPATPSRAAAARTSRAPTRRRRTTAPRWAACSARSKRAAEADALRADGDVRLHGRRDRARDVAVLGRGVGRDPGHADDEGRAADGARDGGEDVQRLALLRFALDVGRGVEAAAVDLAVLRRPEPEEQARERAPDDAEAEQHLAAVTVA